MTDLRILPLGERGLLVEVSDELSVEGNARARALARGLRGLPGVEDVVPALRSVLVVFDPLRGDPARIAEAAESAAHLPSPVHGAGRLVEVPVLYGGGAGPDLEEVAALCGLTPAQVIRSHSESLYTVFMLGFAPGYPYLGLLPATLHVPRLEAPRVRVPRGAVAVAEAMTGIYPLPSAGGWRIIGRTPRTIYDPAAADPVLFRPGDRVRFVPLREAAFAEPEVEAPPVPRHPVFEILSGGLYTTVQDAGRSGYRALGIPPSGPMDRAALWAANAAAGNPSAAPALELTSPGPVLRVLNHATIAVAGADLGATADATPLDPGRATSVRPGQTLRFDAPRAGTWAYLAVAGGVEAMRVLGSASTYVPGGLGGSGGRRLRQGDLIGVGSLPTGRPRRVELPPLPSGEVVVRVIPGPQDEWLTEEAARAVLKEQFRISPHRDRAGVRLAGPALAHRAVLPFYSDGVLPGSVQVPRGGAPIIIMPDGPTTGGYPKVAVVISADLRLVAQAPPGAAIRLRAVEIDAALEALRAQHQTVERLEA